MRLEFRVTKNGFRGATGRTRVAVAKALASEKTVLLEEAKRRTPVDTGELRDSQTAISDATSITLTANAPYAGFVHQGTRYQGARPWLREAVEAGAPKVADAVSMAIEGALS